MACSLRREFQPSVIIHFGVSDRARGFVLERLARNECRTRIDASGLPPEADRLCPRSPERRETRLPVTAIAGRLRDHGLPVEDSEDAGGYLCNAVFFDTLNETSVRAHDAPASITAGFVHIPVLAGDWLDDDRLLQGAILIVETSLDHTAAGRP